MKASYTVHCWRLSCRQVCLELFVKSYDVQFPGGCHYEEEKEKQTFKCDRSQEHSHISVWTRVFLPLSFTLHLINILTPNNNIFQAEMNNILETDKENTPRFP